ncbi:MAG TPA: hypothetical protein VFL83_01810 [Anaeromyxobacter sp.]|nr:hypothetical protein [Anaeromyxobacter sp.]
MDQSSDRGAPARALEALARHDVVASGVVAGAAGAAAMVAVAAVGAASEGLPATHALEVIGASLVGPGAFASAAGKIAFGALVHAAVAAALGILFASIVPRDFSAPNALAVGVGMALFALGVMMGWVVPWANPGFRGQMQAVGGSWVVAHAVFGLALGTTPALRRWLVRAAARAAAAPGLSRAAAVAPPPRAP